ncbi:MAG TPA: glycosyltransferase [Casimicrobiaceae bacterium]|nr:glycosyltransferase [Casimicrobiaceae bacterium]
MPTSICLNMIVKNEAHVIRRCLDSVRPFVSHWVIVDTGSTDDTQDVIRSHMHGISGVLHRRPWRNFGENRSEAIALARGKAAYVLVMDADHEFRAPPGFAFPALDADGYYIRHRYAGVEYGLAVLLSDRIAWRYEGVLHEYVTAEVPHRFVPLDGPWVDVHHEGARSRDPKTYLKDAAVLEAALAKDPRNARYAFYYAQSLKDAGLLDKALAAFRHRATLRGFDEETWHARYQAAQLVERLDMSAADIQRAYLEAFNARPTRAEPLVQLARWHRVREEWALAFLFARTAASIPRPSDHLFVEDAVYEWRADDELAIAAWYAGARDEGRRAAERLIARKRYPPSERERIERNLAFYR